MNLVVSAFWIIFGLVLTFDLIETDAISPTKDIYIMGSFIIAHLWFLRKE